MNVQVPDSLADNGHCDVQVTPAELIRAWKPAHCHASLRLASFLAAHVPSTLTGEDGGYVWAGPHGGGQWYAFTPLRPGEPPSRYLLKEAREHGWLTLTASGRTFDLSRQQPPLLEITVPISQAQYLYLCRAYGHGQMHHPGELISIAVLSLVLGERTRAEREAKNTRCGRWNRFAALFCKPMESDAVRIAQFISTLLGQTLAHLMPEGQQGRWWEVEDAMGQTSPRACAGERAV